MSTTPTPEVLRNAIDGLRQAHADGRPQAVDTAIDDGAVCACVIIAEANGYKSNSNTAVYHAMDELGFVAAQSDPFSRVPIMKLNDSGASFNAVAEYVQSLLSIVEEAEDITRKAVLINA